MRPWVAVVAMLAVLGSCSDPIRVSDEDLRIVPVESGLEVANDSSADLFYQAIDSQTLALWTGPSASTNCVEPACPHVPPGGTTVVPWDAIIGWGDATTRVTVYWWPMTPNGQGGWRMEGENLRSREVLLP
jgi:hypothetical protein